MESKKKVFFSFDETITKIVYICFLIDGHLSKLPFNYQPTKRGGIW